MTEKKIGAGKRLMDGIMAQNPLFRLALGLCPALAVTITAQNGLVMGLATACVLVCTSLVASLLGKVVAEKGRLAVFMLVSACFATVAGMVLEGWFNEAYRALDKLALFVPLIAVNCVILNRADRLAADANPVVAVADAIGMGIGYTLALTLIGVVRELLGSGKLFGASVLGAGFKPMTLLVKPAGGFLIAGLLMGIFAAIFGKRAKKEGEAA